MSGHIRIEHVHKTFAARGGGAPFVALQDITLDIAPGAFLAVVGPSGCGKSTLLDLLAGLASPTSGRILIDGQPVTGPARDRGVVFQQYALFPWRTALDNVAFGLQLAGVPAAARREKAAAYLELVGLAAFADRFPHELSGGMKQRVAIARSLVYEPRVLLMDEPFAALDAQTREHLQGELLRIWRRTGTTIVFITHGIDEAVVLGQRVAVMSSRPGRIKDVFEIPAERGQGAHVLGVAAQFGEVRHAIWSSLRDEVLASQQASHRPVPELSHAEP